MIGRDADMYACMMALDVHVLTGRLVKFKRLASFWAIWVTLILL